ELALGEVAGRSAHRDRRGRCRSVAVTGRSVTRRAILLEDDLARRGIARGARRAGPAAESQCDAEPNEAERGPDPIHRLPLLGDQALGLAPACGPPPPSTGPPVRHSTRGAENKKHRRVRQTSPLRGQSCISSAKRRTPTPVAP